jgi:hypothetical protein
MTSLDTAITGAATTTGPGQGSGSLYHGPWRHEKQTLSVKYIRVPRASGGNSHVLNLSAYTVTAPPRSSDLNIIVEADYEITKTTIGYSVSTPFVQPQTFGLQPASAGPDGTVYHPIASAVSGHFGPAGQIVTTSAFEDRRMWQTSDDGTEVSQRCIGGNMIFYTDGSGAPTMNFNWPLLDYWDSYEVAYMRIGNPYNPFGIYAHLSDKGDPHRWTRLGSTYGIWGLYSVEKEIYGMSQVGRILDYVGNWVKYEQLTVLNPTNSAKGMHYDDISEGCALYDKSRHSYS